MVQLVDFLYDQRSKDSRLAYRLTLLELPNLMAMLDHLGQRGETDNAMAELVADTAGSIEQLLANLNRTQALARAVTLREQAAAALPEWGHARFKNERLQIERLLGQGQLQVAYDQAQALLAKAQAVGPTAYNVADYDLAIAHFLLGRVLRMAGQPTPALEQFVEAQRLFEDIDNSSAARMAPKALTEQADCLMALGRLEDAATKYEENIQRAGNLEDFRQVAVGKGQLATVRMYQGRYDEAIAAHTAARTLFEQQNEPQMVAVAWHQTGRVYQESRQYDAAEAAYRQSLEIKTRMGDRAGQASSLIALGVLYDDCFNRPEEAVTFYRQAADIYVEQGDLRYEGVARNNIAGTLCKLQRYDEARGEILRAIECYQPFGTAVEIWKTFQVLHDIETATGNPAAARTAWQQARDAYLAYRQQGGYAQTPGGKLADQILGSVQQGQVDEAVQFLTQASQSAETPSWLRASAPKILAILNGSRDPALADDPALDYDDAAEVLFLIHRLTQ